MYSIFPLLTVIEIIYWKSLNLMLQSREEALQQSAWEYRLFCQPAWVWILAQPLTFEVTTLYLSFIVCKMRMMMIIQVRPFDKLPYNDVNWDRVQLAVGLVLPGSTSHVGGLKSWSSLPHLWGKGSGTFIPVEFLHWPGGMDSKQVPGLAAIGPWIVYIDTWTDSCHQWGIAQSSDFVVEPNGIVQATWFIFRRELQNFRDLLCPELTF